MVTDWQRIKALRLAASSCAGLSLALAAGAQPASRPNVVFILIDDMGAGDIGCYGSDFYETPNIDAWASQSVRFSSAYASCHVSSPARASLLTGMYPASTGVTDWLPGRREYPFQRSSTTRVEQDLPESLPNMARTFSEAGYATALVGKWHLGETGRRPTEYGFDIHIPEGYLRGWPDTYYYPFGMNGYDGAPGDYLTDKMTDEAVSYIRSHAGGDKPFFLLLSHFATHDPIQGRPDLVEKYRRKLASMPTPDGPGYILEGNPDDPHALSAEQCLALLDDPRYAGHKIFPHNLVKIKQIQDNVNFAAMVESVDMSVGRIRDELKACGIEDNTILVFFADNGGMSAANYGNPNKMFTDPDAAYSSSMLPYRGGKGWMYEGGLRVPLIIDWPGGGRHAVVCDTPVTTPDLFPTLLSMAGIEAPSEFEGLDLTPLMSGRKLKDRALYWHFPHYSNHGMVSPCGAVRLGDWKLIEYYDRGTVQLFNLKKDVSEQFNLAAKRPAKVRKLRKILSSWREDVGAQMPTANQSYSASLDSIWYNDAAPVRYWPCAVHGVGSSAPGEEFSYLDGFTPAGETEGVLADAIGRIRAFKRSGAEAERASAEAVFKDWNPRRGSLRTARERLLWDILCAGLYDLSGHGRFLVFTPLENDGSEEYRIWSAIAYRHVGGEFNNNLEIIGAVSASLESGIKFGCGIIEVSHPAPGVTQTLLRRYAQPHTYKGYSIEVYVGFAAKEVTATLNGAPVPVSVNNRGFVSVRREWEEGDCVRVSAR